MDVAPLARLINVSRSGREKAISTDAKGGDNLASTAQGAGSVSRIECVAQVKGKGEAKVALFRHLAPLTVNAILHSLPLDSRVSVYPAMTSLFTTLQVGVEKPRTAFERGDVAFLAGGGLLCIFLKGARSDRPLNPVGKVEAGAELFDGIRPGDVVRLYLASPLAETG